MLCVCGRFERKCSVCLDLSKLLLSLDNHARSMDYVRKNPRQNHAYMSSHSPSSSSSLGGGGGSFSFTRSFLSKGHVACSFNQGAMHSRSNMWFLLQGRRTTRGYSSAVYF